MDGLAFFSWFFDEPMWVMLFGGLFGVFCVGLFASLHKSSVGSAPPQKLGPTRRP